MGRSLVGSGPFEFLVNAIMRASSDMAKATASPWPLGFANAVRSLFGRNRFDGREASPVAAISKLHPAAHFGEQCVIRAYAHVRPRLDLGAALADDDRAARHEFAAKRLDAQPLRIRIPSVCGAASTLLMCHCRIPFSCYEL